jgi:prephenate dehydratase
MLKIAIQGYQASFHDIAASRLFGPKTGRVYCNSFSDTFKELVKGEADFAVCAIENSLYGSINEVYDLLLKNDFKIIGEAYLRIEQCLIGLLDSDITHIKKVYSHPVALAQCENYLDKNLGQAEREEYHDTAESVALIKRLSNPHYAAIAGKDAATLYKMKILADSIETNKENFTRFVALGKSKISDKNLNKTSLVIKTNHTPGALYKALGVFASRSINLTKLQSRPIIGKAWHYMFYVDIEEARDIVLSEILLDLKRQGCSVTILGSYPTEKSVPIHYRNIT